MAAAWSVPLKRLALTTKANSTTVHLLNAYQLVAHVLQLQSLQHTEVLRMLRIQLDFRVTGTC